MENEVILTGKTAEVKKAKKATAKKAKKLLSTFEFSRAGSVALAIKRIGNFTDEEKIVKLADKIYTEKTGSASNLKESKWNFLYASRFLKYYETESK